MTRDENIYLILSDSSSNSTYRIESEVVFCDGFVIHRLSIWNELKFLSYVLLKVSSCLRERKIERISCTSKVFLKLQFARIYQGRGDERLRYLWWQFFSHKKHTGDSIIGRSDLYRSDRGVEVVVVHGRYGIDNKTLIYISTQSFKRLAFIKRHLNLKISKNI